MSKGIDILLVSHVGHLHGGAEKSLLEFVIFLKQSGVRPYVVLPHPGSFQKHLERQHIPYYIIGQPYWAVSHNDNATFTFTNPDHFSNVTSVLVSLINELQPKLCVTNTMVIPWLAYAAALTGKQHAWIIRELGTSDHRLRFALGEAPTLQAIDTLSDMVFCNSRYTADHFSKRFVRNRDIGLMYPYVAPQQPKKIRSPFRQSALKLVIVGQVKPSKGQFDAVRALGALKHSGRDVQLAIIGINEDPAYTAKIRRYAASHQLTGDTLWLGYQSNPSSYVALADIVLVCSSNEAFGRVTVEGMQLGKPVVGANAGGTAEIIEHNKTGLLYEAGNIDELVSAIINLGDDSQRAKAIGKQAKQNTAKRYSATSCYRDFMQYYKHLPRRKTALDLSPLLSMYDDHNMALSILNIQIAEYEKQITVLNKAISDIRNNLIWRLLRTIRQLLPQK